MWVHSTVKPEALNPVPDRRSVELKHGRIAMLATMGGLGAIDTDEFDGSVVVTTSCVGS